VHETLVVETPFPEEKAVVGTEDERCVVQLTCFFEMCHHLANVFVVINDAGEMVLYQFFE